MEQQGPTGPRSGEGSEGRGKPPQVVQAGSMKEFLEQRLGDPVDQHAGQGSLEQWEAQWQEFLRTLESPRSQWRIPLLPRKPSPWDDAKSFLASFEQVADACQWPQEAWITRLLPALSGEAEIAFNRMDGRDKEDYGKVKAAILKMDALMREKQRQQFRHFCYQEAEGPREACCQLREMCRGWLRVENHSKEQILELLILEQLLTVLPPEIQSWVRETGPESCSQAVALAEEFLLRQQEAKRQEKQVHLEEVAASVSEAGQDPSEIEPSETPLKSLLIEVKEEADGEASPLAESKEESASELRGLSLEKDKNEGSEAGIQKGDPDGIKRKEGNNTVEERDRPVPCPGGDFQETPVQEERPAEKRRKEGLHASQRIHSRETEKESVAFGETFIQKVSVVSGGQIRSGEKPYHCRECEKSFSRRTALTSHQRIHSGDNQENEEAEELHQLPPDKTRNQELKGNFRNRGGRKRQKGSHMVQKRFKAVPYQGGDFCEVIHTSKETYKCLECGLSFSDQTQYDIHLQMHNGRKSHKCLDCGKSFRFKSKLLRHYRIHTGEKPYSCSDCNKSFSRKAYLIEHQRIHSGKGLLLCSECGRSFNWSHNLQKHKRTHTGERLFECSECGKNFTWSGGLHRHLRIHTGEKPFECLKCGKKFSQNETLHQHLRTHTGEKPFKCSECGKKFSRRYILNQHQRIHTAESF